MGEYLSRYLSKAKVNTKDPHGWFNLQDTKINLRFYQIINIVYKILLWKMLVVKYYKFDAMVQKYNLSALPTVRGSWGHYIAKLKRLLACSWGEGSSKIWGGGGGAAVVIAAVIAVEQ